MTYVYINIICARVGHATQIMLRSSAMAERLDATVRQGAYLPHWTKDGATYAVRFRLADSLPQHILKEWREERKAMRQKVMEGKAALTHEEKKRLQELSSEKVERYLRAGYGKCWLMQDRVAQIVADTLRAYDGKRYRLSVWCIMPNHVHVVVQPLTKSLHRILDTWKCVSARKANKILGRKGEFWQPEYFDHLIRSDFRFHHAVEYTWNNPDVAGLKNWKWRWKVQGL